MDRKIFKNYIYNTIYQLYAILVPLITLPYITKTLTMDKYGDYAYTNSIAQWFIITGMLGITVYGSKKIAQVNDNHEDRSYVFCSIYKMQLITTITALIIFLALSIKYTYKGILIYQVIYLISNVIDISWLYIGIEDFRYISIRNMIVKTIVIISIFIFIKDPSDLKIYIMLNGIAALGGNITMWLKLKKIISYKKVKLKEIFIHFKGAISLFIPQIAASVYVLLDRTMLGLLSTSIEVGFYDQAQKFVKIGLVFISTFSTVMLPRMSKTFYLKDDDQMKAGLKYSFSFIMIIASILFWGILICSNDFIGFLLGPDNIKVAKLMISSAPIIIFISMTSVSGDQFLVPTGRTKVLTLGIIFAAVVNLILNAVLIPKYESIGATIATIFAELTVVFIQYPFFARYCNTNIFSILFKYLSIGIPIYVFSSFIIISNNLLSFIIKGILVVLGYGIILLLLKDKIALSIVKKVKFT